MALKRPLAYPRTQMRTLTRMEKGVIEDYYLMATICESELDETNTPIIKILTRPHGLVLDIYLHFKKIIYIF